MTSLPPSAAAILQKSPTVAALLGFFFGPIGLLYVGFGPAILMFIVNFLVGVFTFGLGLFLTWPLCALVGWFRARRFNAILKSVA